MSKRNFKRKVRKEALRYKNLISSVNLHAQQESELQINIRNKIKVDGCLEDGLEIKNPHKTLCDKLKNWYITTKPSRKCLRVLLKILNSEGLNVPLSELNLLGKRECLMVQNVASGRYCHLGINNQLQKISAVLEHYDELFIDINIDGIPLFKSSRAQLWPILFKLVYVKEDIDPFPVGIYLGNSKPSCLVAFCADLVDEWKSLENNFFINEKPKKIHLRCLVCDTPAKAFFLGVPDHTSTHGCTICTQKGKQLNKVLTYSTFSGDLITDEKFSTRKYPEHHQK